MIHLLDGLVQDYGISIALAMEIPQYGIKLSLMFHHCVFCSQLFSKHKLEPNSEKIWFAMCQNHHMYLHCWHARDIMVLLQYHYITIYLPFGCVVCYSSLKSETVVHFNMKISSYHHWKSHSGGETAIKSSYLFVEMTFIRSSYLHKGISYTGNSSFILRKAIGGVCETVYASQLTGGGEQSIGHLKMYLYFDILLWIFSMLSQMMGLKMPSHSDLSNQTLRFAP